MTALLLDPASYTILQEVIRIPYSAPPAHDTPPDVLLSVYYHFIDATRSSPSMSPPLSPHSSCDSELDYRPFPAEPSVSQTYYYCRPPQTSNPERVFQPLLAPLADTFGLHDTLDSAAVPGLIQPYEDAYTSQPGSPLVDMPLVGLSQWGYTPPAMLAAELPAPVSGGDYFDTSLMFSPHVF